MSFQSRLELVVDSRSGEQRLRAFESQLDRAQGSGDRLAKGMGVLKIALGAAAAAAGGFSLGQVVRETASFEQSLLQLQVVSGATATQMAELESLSRRLGATSAFSAKQAADAQNFLAMAGFSVNEVLSATPGILQLATAGSMDLARAADIASNVLGGMRMQVSDLNRVNDVLVATSAGSNTSITQLGDALSYAAPLAATAGISIEQTAAAIGVLSDAGLQSTRAGTGLLGFIRQLSNLTPQATAALSNYGLTAADVNIEQEGLVAVLERLNDANIRTADSFKIFGSEAGPAAQILASGALRVNEFTGELEAAEGAAAKAALVLGSGLEGAMRSFGSAVGEATLQLGRDSGMSRALQEVIGSATGVISVYNGMLPEFQRANDLTDEQASNLNRIATAISLTTGAVGGLTAAYVSLTAATWAAHAAQTALLRIMRINPILLAAGALASLSGAIYTARNRMVEFGDTQASILDWMQGAWSASAEVFSENWDGAVTSVIGMFESIAEPVAEVTSYLWQTFQALMTNLGNITQTTINTMIAYFSTIGDVVGVVTSTMQRLFNNAFDNILSVASGFWQSVQAVFSGDLSFGAFNAALDNLTSGFTGAMVGAADEIGEAFRRNMSRDYLGEAFDSLSSGAQFVADDFMALGERISDAAFQARMARNGFGVVAEGFSDGKTQAQLLQEEIEKLNQGLDETGGASAPASSRIRELADELESLKRQLDPSYSALMQFWEGVELLGKTIDRGTIEGMAEYSRLVGLLTERYREATKGSDETRRRVEQLTQQYDRQFQRGVALTQAIEDINAAYRRGDIDGQQYGRMIQGVRDEMAQLALDADPAAQDMARAWEEAGNRIDETFADAFAGAFDSFSDFTDRLLDGFKRLLAELAYQATLKPIVIQFAQSMGGALGIPGMGAAPGMPGGMNLSPGGIGNAWSAVQSGFGGIQWTGASNTAYAGNGWANAATQGTGATGFMGGSTTNFSGATGLASMGAGFAGSYAGTQIGSSVFGKDAGSSYGATAGALAGTYMAGPIGAAIGGFVGGLGDSLFGKNKKTFDFDFLQGQHSYVFGDRTSAFGDSGLTALSDYKIGEQQDALNDMLTAMAEFDNRIAATAIPERFDAMKDAIDGFTHSGAEDLFETRLRAMIEGFEDSVDVAFRGASIRIGETRRTDASGVWGSDALLSISDPEKLAGSLLAALQLEQIGGRLGTELSAEIQAAISDARGDLAAGVIQSTLADAHAAEFLHNSLERLNLQFDVTAQGALAAAGELSDYAGGIENMAAVQQGYYQAAYSETERLSTAQTELLATLASVTDQAPRTVEELRALVEAQDLNGEASQRLAYDLMALAPALAETNAAVRQAIEQQYQDVLGRAPDAEGMDYWFNQVATGALSLEGALFHVAESAEAAEFAAGNAAAGLEGVSSVLREREQLMRQILQLEGREAELRQMEIDSRDESNRALQQRIHALQDEQAAQQAAQQAAERAQQERIRAIERESQAWARARDQLASFGSSISGWVSQLDSSETGGGSPRQRLESSDADFWAQYQKALGGDRNAQQSITQYADRYIDNLQQMYASGASAQAGIAEVRDAMNRLPEMLSPEQFLAEEFRGIVEDQTGALVSATDLNGDGTVSALERAIAANWGAGELLKNVLHQEMRRLGSTLLTESQVRAALSPIATDAEIDRLLRRVDANGDGMISQQELTVARMGSLATGIASALAPEFSTLDSNLDSKLTFSELQKGLAGMATDAELRNLIAMVDLNGDGQISKIEALISESKTGSELLKTALSSEFGRLGSTLLTESQVRAALKPHATDAEISRLISRVDVNGDGMISVQELTNARIGGLAGGIANAVAGEFSSIDLSGDGLIDYDEFRKAFQGMATDSELRRIFTKLDYNGSGTLSRLDAQTGELKTAAKSRDLSASEQSIVRALNAQQTESVVRWWGHHIANEFERKFSGQRGLGVSLSAWQSYNGVDYIARWNATRMLSGENVDFMGHRIANQLKRAGVGNGGTPYYDGGYTGPGGKYQPAGIVHRGEIVWSQADIARAGGVDTVEALRKGLSAPAAIPLPMPLPLPSFPLLNRNDQHEVMRDLLNENRQLRKELSARLDKIEKHSAAAVQVQQAGFNGQINEQKKGNAALEDMSAAARLEAAR